MQTQLSLLGFPADEIKDYKMLRSGTFVDNMSLPIHRWFRYSAGFSASWVEQVFENWGIAPGHLVLDPFAGAGTVSIVCDSVGVKSIGVEANSFLTRIFNAKLLWSTSARSLSDFSTLVLEEAAKITSDVSNYPTLIKRSYDVDTLSILDSLKTAWFSIDDKSPESELTWLALTSILRSTSIAGTAPWQYILPNKKKKRVLPPFLAFQQQIEIIKADIRHMQTKASKTLARIEVGDARNLSNIIDESVDAVITSPPYANNYDYADALRFEMTFWGVIKGWGDLHDAVRKHLIVSSSQHSSHERIKAEEILDTDAVKPIKDELQEVVHKLTIERELHGGKKHYHTMVAAYCRDISLVLRELRRVCKPNSKMCWVIGDSAPYGIYCPIEVWISTLAESYGFKNSKFDKIRDRNIKWKNRKHNIPLKEGLLWLEG